MSRVSLTILFFLSFLFVQCEDSGSDLNQEQYELQKIGERKIFIDSTTNLVSTFMTYFQEGKNNYLVFENRYENAIQFYDLSTGRLAFKTSFEEKGDNSLGGDGVGGFFIHSLDSIFVIGRESSRISLTNKQGDILNSVRVTPDGDPYWDLIGVNKVPLVYHDEKLYVIGLGDFPIFSEPANGQPLEIEVDFFKDDSKVIFAFPNIYEGFYGPYHTHPCRTFNGRQLVYSFPISPDLYVFDPLTRETEKHSISSPYVKVERFKPLNVVNQETMRKATIEQGIFMEVVYDAYRGLYYRFVLHPTDLVDPASGFVRSGVAHKPFSIQIIDKDFNKLGETYFPPMELHQKDFFVGPEGLYISENHPNRTDLNESELVFSIFRPIEEE